MIEKITTETIPRPPDIARSVELVVEFVAANVGLEYYAYERNKCWHIGLGRQSSLAIDSAGKLATIQIGGHEQQKPILSTLHQVARDFVTEYSDARSKVFGYIGYNYAAHIRGIPYTPGEWPLLSLMIPRHQITVKPESITVQGRDDEIFRDVVNALRLAQAKPPAGTVMSLDVSQGATEYVTAVDTALAKIRDGEMTKVIVSRAMALPNRVNMPATLLVGRQSNTPKRSFSFSYAGFESTGFSPELIASVVDGKVTTEPLAGTRAYPDDQKECVRLRNELVNDPKEVIEHVVSVKEAIAELERICSQESVAVEDLMSVRTRGRVQHLGSRVAGKLDKDKDFWDALNVLFPSITASGVPKEDALRAIESLEPRSRELYSGGIIMMDPSSNDCEATLVLRSVFQDSRRQWIQAGAGVISQSHADREFTETCEKLATIAPFLVKEQTCTGARE